MKNDLYAFARKLKPLAIVYMGLMIILRLVFTVWEHSALTWDVLDVLNTLVRGVIFDAAVLAYFSAFWAFCFLLTGFRRKVADNVIFFGITYLLLFTAIAEIIFWEEFESRFNFIAVDYLVYTHEVVGNIWESYPIVWLLSGIALAAFALTRWYARRAVAPVEMPARRRVGVFGVSVVVAVCSFFIVSKSWSSFGEDRYWQEIAKNGYFELFSAFRNNEISYNKFYIKSDAAAALDDVRQTITSDKSAFVDDKLTHRVSAKAPEVRKNIMLITVESLSGDYFTAFGNKKGLTPYMDKLADQSMFFTNLYATGTRTVYGLSAVNLSIPPIPGNSIVRRPENEGLFSLAAVLNKKGYDSRFVYGGFGYFDNMNYFFENNGYKIVDRDSMTDDEVTFANVWGVCDEDLFNKSMKEADASFAAGRPFFNMMMTTSNHRPYTYPDGKIDIPSGKGRSGGVKYTDYAIQQFIEKAQEKPWFKDTIFVIVADHTASSSGKTAIDPDRYHIPLIIYAPGFITPQKVDKLASQIDLAPTLLGLMNMRYDSRFYGADLMKQSPNRAFLSNYQRLGYMTDGKLVILEPIRQSSLYVQGDKGWEKSATEDAALKQKAVSIFQTAARWKDLSRDVQPPQ